MTECKSSTVDKESEIVENARIGYEMAITLWTFQGEQRWARFNTMLLVNSIILGVIGLIITNPRLKAFNWRLGVLAFLGLFLCIIWFVFAGRESKYTKYYAASARQLEKKYLSKPVETVSRGKRFANGEEVEIKICDSCDSSEKLCLSWLERCLTAKRAACVIILILVVLYGATILYSLRVWPFA